MGGQTIEPAQRAGGRAGVRLALLLLFCGSAWAADPAFYNVCAGKVGNLRFSNRAADQSFVVRCPDGSEEIVLRGCTGSLTLDVSYNAVITCRPSGKRYPIIRGTYPR